MSTEPWKSVCGPRALSTSSFAGGGADASVTLNITRANARDTSNSTLVSPGAVALTYSDAQVAKL